MYITGYEPAPKTGDLVKFFFYIVPFLLTVSRRFSAIDRMFPFLYIINLNMFKENSFSFFKIIKTNMIER